MCFTCPAAEGPPKSDLPGFYTPGNMSCWDKALKDILFLVGELERIQAVSVSPSLSRDVALPAHSTVILETCKQESRGELGQSKVTQKTVLHDGKRSGNSAREEWVLVWKSACGPFGEPGSEAQLLLLLG